MQEENDFQPVIDRFEDDVKDRDVICGEYKFTIYYTRPRTCANKSSKLGCNAHGHCIFANINEVLSEVRFQGDEFDRSGFSLNISVVRN